MDSGKKLTINYIYSALFQVTNILVPIVTLPYLTRVLHAEGLGMYSYAYSIAYYHCIFIRLGLNNYGNRTIAFVKDDPDRLSQTFFEIYATQAFMWACVSIVYFAYCITLAPYKHLAFIFFMLIIATGTDLSWAFYGLENFKIISIRDIMTKLITAICIFAFVRNAEDVWKYAAFYSGGMLINHLVVIPIIAKKIHYVRPTVKGIYKHIKPNLILFLPSIAVSIYKTMDRIMLGAMSSNVELGYYHSTENIIKVPMALIDALGAVMLPRMSNMLSKNEGEERIKELFKKSIMFAIFISSSTCIGIMTVSKEIVPIIFGPGFEKCITLFLIILPSCIFLAFANVIRTQYLLPRKRDMLFVSSLFAGAAVNVTLNFLLIPRLASIGAAIGTLAAEIVVCVVQSACVFKEANIGRNIINSLPFLFAGIVMFVAFHNYSLSIHNSIVALLVKIVISGLLYLSVLGVIIMAKRVLTQTSHLGIDI